MKYRMAVILATYSAMFVVCYFLAFLLRFDFDFRPDVREAFAGTVIALVGVKLLTCLATGEWQRSYRFATFPDLLYVVGSTLAAAAILFAANQFSLFGPVPRTVILIDALLTIPASGFIRVAARIYTEVIKTKIQRQPQKAKQRALIVGADREAVEILRAIQAGNGGYEVVGLIASYSGRTLISGVPTYSHRTGLKKLSAKLNATTVLIPSSVPGPSVREIVDESRAIGLKTHVIPSVHEIVGGRYKLNLRDVTITDLLRRKPAKLDMQQIRGYVENRCVLVTGAAGSIGSEVCRQLLRFRPNKLVLLDQSELGMFLMTQEFDALQQSSEWSPEIRFVVADVTSEESLRRAMKEHRPQTVFHAAAYKHVPLMEENIREAVRNNVFGTRNVVDRAEECGVERFVLISTDKAVRPSSVMGATKLVAERYVHLVAGRSRMRCITVRFGNVLNSAGSVVPTFRAQIERGGPVTVTHRDIERYFMTIPEAVQLVLQAGAVGASGDLLVLEMGKPCRIVDLAKDMIALSGLRYPEDIEIVFTGLRPGEKLTEELFYESEECSNKVHEKIFCAKRQQPVADVLERQLAELRSTIDRHEHDCGEALWAIVNRHVTESGAVDPATLPLRKAA